MNRERRARKKARKLLAPEKRDRKPERETPNYTVQAGLASAQGSVRED